MRRRRLDELLVDREFVKDKREAFIFVTGGRVFVDGQRAISPSQKVAEGARVEIRSGQEYVGRGAHKLEAALARFKVGVRGKTCADIGSAIGGFVEVLLKRGARIVYAVDTARGKLALKIRLDPRVKVMDGTDVRDLESLPEPADVVTVDVSLVSLRQILPAVSKFLSPDGDAVALFKPQYETRNPLLLKRGVVRDDAARKKLLYDFEEWVGRHGWDLIQKIESPIRGAKGNLEYLLHLKRK